MLIMALWRLAREETRERREGWPEMAGAHRGVRSDGRENRLKKTSLLHFFADLVIIAGWLHPIPFRTRP